MSERTTATMPIVQSSTGRPRRSIVRALIAWGIAALALLVSVFGLAVWTGTPLDVVTFLLLPLAYGGIGAYLTVRVPANPIGPMLLAAAIGFALLIGSGAVVVLINVEGTGGALATIAGLVANLTFIPSLVLVIVGIPLVFPDGRFLSARWRWVAIGAIVTAGAAELSGLLGIPQLSEAGNLPNPFYVPALLPILEVVDSATTIVAIPIFGLALASVVVRYRRSDEVGRHQIRWLAAASSVALITFALSFLSPPVIGPLLQVLGNLSITAIPLAIGIAIVRYRLYDIDRLISRGISYGLVTVVLLGTYVAIVLFLQGPLGAWFGTQTVTVAISTLVVAGLFQPVRSRIQRAVDRRFDRARFDTERTAAAFSDRLRAEVDIDAVVGDLATTASGAVRPASVTVWLREPAVPS
jgi:hypothetical protein